MKKILFLGMLFASMGVDGQVSEPFPTDFDYERHTAVPPVYMSDNKVRLCTYVVEEEGNYEEYEDGYKIVTIKIYNDLLEVVKTINTQGKVGIPYFLDYTHYYECEDLPITQTLFNKDEKYEYVRLLEENNVYLDIDGDNGLEWVESVGYGFEILNEDGKVLQTIRYDVPLQYPFYRCIKLNDKTYWVSVSDTDNGISYWYEITGIETGLKKVQTPVGLSVLPSLAKRHQSITIEADDESKNREVNIVDASGKSVWKQIIPAGQKSIRVNAAKLSKGLNVVNVDGEKEKSVKVIVN